MDTAVALIETYLGVNGYFTVTEYPIIETARSGGYRTVTDLDVLAVRFPGAGVVIPNPSATSNGLYCLPIRRSGQRPIAST
jgi:hypothetical protein